MASITTEKLSLWIDMDRGLTTRFSSQKQPPVLDRDSLTEVKKQRTLSRAKDRGDRLQELRLRRYPSIDVNHDKLFAGYIEGDLERAHDALLDMGYRNNPTAYVEISDELGSDDASYARQNITEGGGGFDIPTAGNRVRYFRRLKRQLHVVCYEVRSDDEEHEMFNTEEDIVVFYAHEEKSAWLQPARHVTHNDSSARIGIRDFRNQWYDTFRRELPGKDEVSRDVLH